MGPGPGTLIGRERELAAFRLVLDEVGVGGSRAGAAGDGGSFLLVTGEPGIGKTRLLEAAAAEAEARGFLVAWGRAWEAGGAPAFWPWIQIRRALDRERGRTAAPASAAVAATFPDLAVAGTPGGPEGAAPGAGTSDRFLLFDAVAQALIAASAERPLLLLLDDLHAADPSSIQLLELVTGQVGGARVAIVGSYREVEARILPEVRDPLGRLSRRARTLPLGRMGRAEVAAFVRRSPTLPDDDTVVGLVHDATDGNPLFIGELVRLIETRAGETRAGRLPVPDGVRAVMRERIRLLPPACAELLAHAAVIGREFQSPLLAEVAAVAVDAVPTALAAAVETGLLEERAPGHYAFSHALVVETLVRDLEPGRRAALHLMVARALERRHQDDPAAPLGTLAHHFLESGALSAAEAVAAARRAAARALEGLAFEDAAALLERALASEALVVPPDGARRAELLLSLGEASLRGGAADRGKQACQEAAELARALGRPDLLARAALGYGLEFAFAVVDARLVALLEEALRALPATDRSLRWLRARVMARLAAALQPAIDPTAPVALAREAIALVQAEGAAPPEPGAPGPDEAAAVRLDVLHIAGSALVEYVPSEELIPLHEEVVALAGARRDRPRRLRALLRLVFAHLERGDRAASRRAVGDYEAAAAEFTQPRYRWPSILLRSMEAALDGRFDACARFIAEARALDAGADANLHRSLNAHRVLVAGQAIEDAEAREVLEEHLTMIAPGGHDHVSRVWRAIMPANVRAGLFEPGLLAAFTEAQLVALCQDFNVACLLAEACAMVDDRAHAAPIAAALAARAGRVCVTTMGFGVQDLADRSLLLLATLRETWDEVERHAAAALALAERLGAPPFVARVRFDLAAALARRGRQADRGRARELAAFARAEAERMRMLGLAREARALEERLGPPAAVAAAPPVTRSAVVARREGDFWTVSGAGELTRVRDSRGMRMLAVLLERPGCEVHVLELSGSGGSDRAAVDGGDSGPALDAEARAAYQARLVALQSELEEAEAWNDEGRRERAQREREALAAELARAVGLGGRMRRDGGPVERARVNVQRRLADALRRVQEGAPTLGRYLAATVKTGVTCIYQPLA